MPRAAKKMQLFRPNLEFNDYEDKQFKDTGDNEKKGNVSNEDSAPFSWSILIARLEKPTQTQLDNHL